MRFNLAGVCGTSKRYAQDSSISNERFLNALLEPYVVACNVSGRGGENFYLDKHRVSKIVNGLLEVPAALRRARAQHGAERRIATECGILFDEVLDMSMADDLAEDLLSLLKTDDAKQSAIAVRLGEVRGQPCLFMARVLYEVMGVSNLGAPETVLWRSGTGSFCWREGDLLAFGFGNRKKKPNLVVIPVDCAFRTHVTWKQEGVALQEVSPNSLHGKWLMRMCQIGFGENEITERLAVGLKGRVADTEGNYPVGTVVPIEDKNAVYLLLAVSEFDRNGNAHSTASMIGEAAESLLRYYDMHGQGLDLYVPLMGTGLSRAGLQPEESFGIIQNAVTSGKSFVAGKITAVILPAMVQELGLE